MIQLLSTKVSPLADAIFVMWCGKGVLVCTCSVLTQSLRQMLLAHVRGRAIDVSFGWTNMAIFAFCAVQRKADKGVKLSFLFIKHPVVLVKKI